MSRAKIAPTLRLFVAGPWECGWRPDPESSEAGPSTARALRELRDLLAVWRAAKPLAALIRHALDKGDQVCGAEVRLMLAVEKAKRRVSAPRGNRRTRR